MAKDVHRSTVVKLGGQPLRKAALRADCIVAIAAQHVLPILALCLADKGEQLGSVEPKNGIEVRRKRLEIPTVLQE
jgi:hypothetical protein